MGTLATIYLSDEEAKAHEWKTKPEPLIYGKDRTLVRKRLGKKK